MNNNGKNMIPASKSGQQIPHMKNSSVSADDAWKAVGSPPRGRPFSVPQTPERSNIQPIGGPEHDEDLILSRKRNIRSRAASTPNPQAHDAQEPYFTYALVEEDESGEGVSAEPINPKLDTSMRPTSGSGKWAPSISWAPASSMWGQAGGASSSRQPQDTDNAAAGYPYGYGGDGLGVPPLRQFRSFSFSLESSMGPDRAGMGLGHRLEPDPYAQMHRQAGNLPVEEESDVYGNGFALPKARSRSKSSSAIYGLIPSHEIPALSFTGELSDTRVASNDSTTAMGPGSPTASKLSEDGYMPPESLWPSVQMDRSRMGHEPYMNLHRRASTQPNYSPIWESQPGPSVGGMMRTNAPSSSPGMGSESPNNPMSSPSMLSAQRPRRYSHAPALYYQDYGQYDGIRRHSVAGQPNYIQAPSSPRYLAEAMNQLQIEEMPAASATQPQPPAAGNHMYDEINDYFENTESRARAWVEAGKNLQQMQSSVNQWPVYMVEFKAGRTDFFYISEPGLAVTLGDLVIVEADRGKDLGKVIVEGIMNMQQLQMHQAQHADRIMDGHYLNRDIHPKRIYRLAQPNEVAMLVAKSQDENKSKAVCQTKIRQKQLPMEVVDAEYQWDRRKLTFYFVAERRIDFRELVRELFRIYKTRIWMCAVNPVKSGSNQ